MASPSTDWSSLTHGDLFIALHAEIDVNDSSEDPVEKFRPAAVYDLVQVDTTQEVPTITQLRNCCSGPYRENIDTRARGSLEKRLFGRKPEPKPRWVDENWPSAGKSFNEASVHQQMLTEFLRHDNMYRLGKQMYERIFSRVGPAHPLDLETDPGRCVLASLWGDNLAKSLQARLNVTMNATPLSESPPQNSWLIRCTNRSEHWNVTQMMLDWFATLPEEPSGTEDHGDWVNEAQHEETER